MTIRDSVKELIDCAGTQFDPEAVKAFIDVLIMRQELKPEDFDSQLLEKQIQASSQQRSKAA